MSSFSNSKPYLLITLIAYSTFSLCLSQELDFQINDFSSPAAPIIFDRDAFVPRGSRLARLIKTNDSGYPEEYSVGRVLYDRPITFWEPGKQLSFEVTLGIITRAVNSEPADGLTFFIVPAGSITPTGGEGNGLGIFGALNPASSPIFAAVIDVYEHGQSNRQIGINIDGRTPKASSPLSNSILWAGANVSITYDATTGRIEARASPGTSINSVSYVYDLKKSLPQQVQIGVSAATGTQVGIFDLFQWNFHGEMVDDQPYIKQYV